MPLPFYSRRNLKFMLYEVHNAASLTGHAYFAAHDEESFDMAIDTAAEIAEQYMRPALRETDKQPPQLVDGKVKTHPALRSFYHAFCSSGLVAATFDEEHGGEQLPYSVYACADFICCNAHNGFAMFINLSRGAADVLAKFALPQLAKEWLPKIMSGQCAATMCLTEPQAGSSLSDIATTAYPQPDGTYKIQGQKIFISAGEHDATENIMHLVLARIDGAPAGTKGLSLFVVPKMLQQANGGYVNNDVHAIGIYHKMGQRSTPAMHLAFGTNNNCTGHLVGEANKGLQYMFNMMNASRLNVGMAASAIATQAYYASLQYAKERPQGRKADSKLLGTPQTEIIHHPDVRRMLLLQKAVCEGSFSLALQCYTYLDLEKISHGAEKEKYNSLLELLTPVVKTYSAEMGIVSVNNAMQVLGGYGYTEDFIIEQLARDIRIMSLYEGTTGIQSQALLGRQVPMQNGAGLRYLKQEVLHDIAQANRFTQLQPYAEKLTVEIIALEKVTSYLLGIAAKGSAEIFLADATLYMELFGIINIAWQWLKQATAAAQALKDNTNEQDFYHAKIHCMKFYFHYELLKTKGLCARLMDEEVLTVENGADVIM